MITVRRKEKRECAHPKCDRIHHSHNYCKTHALRLKKHGDVNYVGKPGPKKKGRQHCSVAECEREMHAKDLCGAHYYRQLRANKKRAIS